MENIYLEEITNTGNINIEKLMFDISCVNLKLYEQTEENFKLLTSSLDKLNFNLNQLFKHIKFQDKVEAAKTWKDTFVILKNLPNIYFELRKETLEDNLELIEKYTLPKELENELLGMIDKNNNKFLI